MADVFISYKRQDRAWAVEVDARLRKEGYTTWWDSSLVAGDQFTDTIQQELEWSKAVVVLWSENSRGSKWVNAEATHAHERDILVCARIDGTNLRVPFNTIQTADLRSEGGFQQMLAGVHRKVRPNVARSREAARSVVPPPMRAPQRDYGPLPRVVETTDESVAPTGPPSRRGLIVGGALAVGAGAVALGISLYPRGSGSSARAVNFYNWDTYIGETTLADFQAATGARVQASFYATNDELFARLRAGNPGFDVIVPSNEFVTRMAQAQMIQALDHSRIPNKANLLPEFQDAAFDPGRRYSMPYTWLTLGIGYRRDRVNGVPNSWRYLFDSPQYSGRIALLSESADLIRLCAKYKGHSVNNIPDAMLTEIEQMLIRQKPHIKAFHEDDGQDLRASGEIDIVLEYNGDLAQLMAGEGGDAFDFVVPQEGTLINSDCLCIPTGAPNPDDAHAFINYLLDAEAGQKITEEIQYPTPNAAVRDLMPDSYKNNPVIFPPADVMAKSEYGAFEGDERSRLYEEIFTRINAA